MGMTSRGQQRRQRRRRLRRTLTVLGKILDFILRRRR